MMQVYVTHISVSRVTESNNPAGSVFRSLSTRFLNLLFEDTHDVEQQAGTTKEQATISTMPIQP